VAARDQGTVWAVGEALDRSRMNRQNVLRGTNLRSNRHRRDLLVAGAYWSGTGLSSYSCEKVTAWKLCLMLFCQLSSSTVPACLFSPLTSACRVGSFGFI